MLKRTTLLILSLMLLTSFTTAQELAFSNYTISLNLNENTQAQETITVTLTNLSPEPVTEVDYTVSTPAQDFTANDATGTLKTTVENAVRTIHLRQPLKQDENTTVVMNFTANDLITSSETSNLFSIRFTAPVEIQDFKLNATLPAGSYVTRTQNIQAPLDVFPEPTRTTTDGEKITLTWEKHLNQQETIGVILRYNKPGTLVKTVIQKTPVIQTKTVKEVPAETYAVFAALIILSALLGFLTHQTLLSTKVKKVKQYLGALRSNEQEIVKLLEQGSKTQAELQKATSFSKAKLSRLIKSMQERKLVSVQRHGRTNQVTLEKK